MVRPNTLILRYVTFILVLSTTFVTSTPQTSRFHRIGAIPPPLPESTAPLGDRDDEDILGLTMDDRGEGEGAGRAEDGEAGGEAESSKHKRLEEPADAKEEYLRQLNIEKFKQTILRRLHLTAPPDLTKGGLVSNRTIGNKLLTSLPLALQNHLLKEFRTVDGAVEPLADRTDEKETLILLNHLQWMLPAVSSATFSIELADNIDPARIQEARLSFETSESSVKGKRLEVWEVFFRPKQTEEEEFDYGGLSPFRNITRLFEQHGDGSNTLPAPTVIRTEGDQPLPSDTIHIRPHRISESVVTRRPGRVGVDFDISSSLAHWIAYRRRQPFMTKVIRTVIVVCPECDSALPPVDLRKGILEIRHRNVLRRSRRSLDHAGVADPEMTIGNLCSRKGHKFSCCTQPFSLNFEDVGWNNWIIHPKKVEPNYCHGSCQAEGIQKTPHSDLMHIYRSQNYGQLSEVQREAMLSCCHPTKMASMSVLYVDPNKELRINTLHNIIVLECSCS